MEIKIVSEKKKEKDAYLVLKTEYCLVKKNEEQFIKWNVKSNKVTKLRQVQSRIVEDSSKG